VAALKLLKKLEADTLEIIFLIELEFLNGRQKLEPAPVRSLITY
jgi:adenine/guanine phosphoribosyltransferase-like PRPP-binding protein